MGKLTPMMAQYKAIKANHQDAILMFRMGDFYEMFFEDALEASKILQIALTSRNKNSEDKAPMCGIPYHAVDNYLVKLTRAGKKVAICDQMTEPNGKGIVQREVVRVVTPGTTFDENILQQKANNYLASIVQSGKSGQAGEQYAIAFCDVTTGEFKVTELADFRELETELMRLRPAECIADEELIQDNVFKSALQKIPQVSAFAYSYFGEAESELKKHFEINSLGVFGLEKKNLAMVAAGMLLNYLKETQKTELKHIRKIVYYQLSEHMLLDQAVIRNLELFFNNYDGKKENSLIAVLDQTMTPMGGRLLRNWLIHPLLDRGEVEARLNTVETLLQDSGLLRNLREKLSEIFDVERLLSRLSLGTGNARDLLAMKQSLMVVPEVRQIIEGKNELKFYAENLKELPELVGLIEKAIVDEPPITVREGGMIKAGFHGELDELKSISTEGKTFIRDLQIREIQRTGISSLKVKFNKVFGYYIEISKANLSSVPDDYIRKQTLVNAERFITPELKEYEDKVLNAEERIKELEYELFYQVRMAVVKEIVAIQMIARALAKLDVFANFAYVAVKNNYCKPELKDGRGLKIVNGRHPVIEQMNFSQSFVPNDCEFEEKKNFVLLTGPNMGGKSTYLRQVALIVLMAQIGSFVPAESVQIGIVDRIFTRVGASDNLARGESTFMVEMQEAAYILNNASERSLIIFDELGRGTSTYDGVSIAWAVMEYVHDKIGAKTLFATHYHELTELADKLACAVNMSVAVRENEREGVVFLYKVVSGGVDKSYGIEVAKLAGLPLEVIGRARGVLDELETKHIQKTGVHKDQITMFEGPRAPGHLLGKEKEVLKALETLANLKGTDVNQLTPLQALQKINELKNKL